MNIKQNVLEVSGIVGLTQDSWNNEPQRHRGHGEMRI